MRIGSFGKFVGYEIGKAIGNWAKKDWDNQSKEANASSQGKVKHITLAQSKGKIRTLTDEEFEELTKFINEEVCIGIRRYADPRHEVYSRLKHDMISYQ